MPPKEIKINVLEELCRDAALPARNVLAVVGELRDARAKWCDFNSPHEGYAVIKEEVDELWDAVKANDLTAARIEAVQVAAMALRFLTDTEHLVDATVDDVCDECGGRGQLVCPLCDWTMAQYGDYWGCDRCNLLMNIREDRMAPLNKPDDHVDGQDPWILLAHYHDGRPDAEAATDWIPGVKFQLEGDSWMCASVDFEDLVQSPAGFGDSKVKAYRAYLRRN